MSGSGGQGGRSHRKQDSRDHPTTLAADPSLVINEIRERGVLRYPVMAGEEPDFIRDPATGDWSGARATGGAETFVPAAGSRVFTLTCSGDGGSISRSVRSTVP